MWPPMCLLLLFWVLVEIRCSREALGSVPWEPDRPDLTGLSATSHPTSPSLHGEGNRSCGVGGDEAGCGRLRLSPLCGGLGSVSDFGVCGLPGPLTSLAGGGSHVTTEYKRSCWHC